MSEQPKPPAAPTANRMTLKELLVKIEQIAFGEDANHVRPEQEDYDKTSAPNDTMQWCANIFRFVVMRLIDHVIEFRKGIRELREINVKRDEDMKEIFAFMKDVTQAVQAAQQGGLLVPVQGETSGDPGAPPQTPGEDAAPVDEEQMRIDELAARAARGEPIPPPPTPIRPTNPKPSKTAPRRPGAPGPTTPPQAAGANNAGGNASIIPTALEEKV